MSYTDEQVSAVVASLDKRRGGETGELGAALAVVGLSADRALKEARIRDDMIRVAHRSGASLRQLAEVSGLDRKRVSAIVGTTAQTSGSSSSAVREQPTRTVQRSIATP